MEKDLPFNPSSTLEMRNPYSVLHDLGIELSSAAAAAGAYVPVVREGTTIYTSGHLARDNGTLLSGKVGRDFTTVQARLAARAVAIDLISALHTEIGDLAKIKRILKVTVLVNSTEDFNEQHLVANGCSELLRDVFGEAGSHTRCAYGVTQIPLGACLEIDLTAELVAP